MRTENGGNEVEKWSGGHFWASRGTLRTTSGGLRPLGEAREPKRDENGSYRIPPGGPFRLKNHKNTSKKWVSRQTPFFYVLGTSFGG